MQKKAHDWQILDLYSRSWQIVKSNKILWLFGIASAGSLGFRFNFPVNNLYQKNEPSTTNKVTQVLGDSTNAIAPRLGEIVASVPLWQYALLGLLVLIVIVVGLILNLVYQAWVNGSLIAGISISSIKGKTTINESSHKSFPALKGLIWLNTVPTLVLALISILVFGVLGVAIVFAIVLLPSIAKLIPIIFLIILIFIWIYCLVLFTLAQIWAIREVVLDRKSAFEAFKHSLRVVKIKYWTMALLAVVNTLLSMAVIFLLMIPMVILFVIGIFILVLVKDIPLLISIFGTVGLLVLLAWFLTYKISSGILNSFKASVWTLAYQHTRGEAND